MTKQSQKNIQIVKVQVGDVRKKRKARKKTVKRRVPPFSGTGLAPVLGLTQYPANRAGTQFDPPNINRMVDPEWFKAQKEFFEKQGTDKLITQEEMRESLDQLKELQDYMRRKGEAPSPYNIPTSAPISRDPFFQEYRFSDTPTRPLDRPQQPLVSAEVASSSAGLGFNDPTGKFGYRPAKK
jgi:hypothetical protein